MTHPKSGSFLYMHSYSIKVETITTSHLPDTSKFITHLIHRFLQLHESTKKKKILHPSLVDRSPSPSNRSIFQRELKLYRICVYVYMCTYVWNDMTINSHDVVVCLFKNRKKREFAINHKEPIAHPKGKAY